MNVFVKHLLTTMLPQVETEVRPALTKFLVERADTALEGLVQAGPIRDLLEKFLADNADALVTELYAALNAAVAGA